MCKGGGCIKKLIIFFFIVVFYTLIAVESLKKIPYSLISPEDIKISWTIENSKIAAVTKKGVLKGLAVGMTNLTAFANGISESSTVYIKEPVPCVDINYTKNIIFGFEPLSEYLINNEL